MFTLPMASAYIANLAPANLRGRYLGVSGLTWSLALVFGPALGMKLLTVSPAIYFAACGALGLLAAGIILIAVRPQPVVKPGPLQKNLSSARAAD
jgi:MFS family permease